MFTVTTHRRLLPALLVAAAIPLGAPALAHASTHRPPPGVPRAHPSTVLVVPAKHLGPVLERRDIDAPAVAAG